MTARFWFACSVLLLSSLAPVSGANQPNILFIFSDDHRHDLLGKVNSGISTPNLDALADTGVRFDRAYVITAICSPSRAAILSGRYGTRNGVPTLSGPLDFPTAALPHALAGAGYRTAQAGKWHLGTTPAQAGFQDYARINSNGSWFNRSVDTNITGVAGNLGGTFYETFMADVVIDWIDDHVANHSGQPFFLWWCNQVPHVDGGLKYRDIKTDPANKVEHTPAGSAGGYQAGYNVADMVVPGNWSNDPSTWGPAGTKPGYLATSRFVTKSATENYGGPGGYTNPAAGVRNATLGEDNVQQHMLEYYASVTALDAEIGRVLDRLEDPNGDGDTTDSIADNTWIVFMGDNGWQTGHHKFTSKVLAYEESARVPLIIKAPGVTPRVENKFALNIDLTAMFHDLAGLALPAHLQGANLRSLVENPSAPWRDRFYYEAVIPEASLDADPHDALRTSQYKFIRTYASQADAQANTNITFEELYDLDSDPLELNNLAEDAAFAATVATLTTQLEADKAAIAGSPDPVLSGSQLQNGSFDTGDKTGWDGSISGGGGNDQSTVVATPLDGGSHSLQFNAGSSTSAVEQVGLNLQDFTAGWHFQYDGAISNRVMNVQLRSAGTDRLNIRINSSGVLQFYNGSTWTTPTGITGTNSFEAGTVYRFSVTGVDWGDTASVAANAGTYTMTWTDLDDGSSSGSYQSAGQSNNGYRFAMPNTLANGELDGIRFLDDFGNSSDPDWRVDGVEITGPAAMVDPFLKVDAGSTHPDFDFGTTSPGAPSRTVTFINSSPTESVTVEAATLLADAGGLFTLGALSLPVVLAPTDTLAATVTATSNDIGIFSGTLCLDTADNSPDLLLPLAAEFVLANELSNPGFESNPFDLGWDTTGTVITETGLNGSATSARLGFGTSSTLCQTLATPLTDFTFDTYLTVAGSNTTPSFRILFHTAGGLAVELRGRNGNNLQLNDQGSYADLTSIITTAPFPIAANTPIRLRLVGRHFGSANAEFDVAWSDPGSTNLIHAAHGLTAFISATNATASGGLTKICFDHSDSSAHSFWVDDISVLSSASTPPAADHEYAPPLPDKGVKISGGYPHLAMTNSSNECGPGAIVPWADRLWAVTYSPHSPNGSSSSSTRSTARSTGSSAPNPSAAPPPTASSTPLPTSSSSGRTSSTPAATCATSPTPLPPGATPRWPPTSPTPTTGSISSPWRTPSTT